MIKQVAIISIPVSNQEGAKEFYVGALGLECTMDAPFGPDRRWIEVKPPGSDTILALVNWFDNMPPGGLAGLVFQVDDIDATYADMVARGVQFEGPPFTEPYGKFAKFKDPDGNSLILQQNL
jgi:predicted enzyme related to lactoylglutathione lyase